MLSPQPVETVKVLGVCGSLQAKSSNMSLLLAAAAMAPDGMHVEIFDGLRTLPHFNPDLEVPGPLPVVDAWRRAIATSDALFIASPEYGHSLPGVLKNAIDWVIPTGELEGKLVAVTASTVHAARGLKGLEALRVTLGAVNARIIGGLPTVRGPSHDEDVRMLLDGLVAAWRSSATIEGVVERD